MTQNLVAAKDGRVLVLPWATHNETKIAHLTAVARAVRRALEGQLVHVLEVHERPLRRGTRGRKVPVVPQAVAVHDQDVALRRWVELHVRPVEVA